MPDTPGSNPPELSWTRLDLEERLGMSGGRFTSTNPVVTVLLATLLTVAAYGAAIPFRERYFVQMFTERGLVQYVTVFFSALALVTLLIKAHKIRVQRKAMKVSLLPHDPDFVLSASTAAWVMERLHEICDQPRRFLLFNRLELALSNLKNMGRISDFDDVLRSQGENDENMMESSYSFTKGLIWAIPVLGFIGTVQGLSMAVGNFGSVLSNSTEVSTLKPALRGVTVGLAIAFETTLVALVAALAIQLLLTAVKRAEERLLDDFNEYCQRHVVARLKITAFD